MPPGRGWPYDQLVTWVQAKAAALSPRRQDLVLAVALAVANLAVLLVYRHQLHPLGWAVVLIVGQNIPLIWRRSQPVAVLLASGAARVAYDVIGLGYAPLPLGTAIAFYTVMDRSRPWVRLIACVLALLAIAISQSAPGHHQPYDFAIAALILAAAGMAGILSRTRRAYVDEVEARAALAESDRDREASRSAAMERARIARELHDVVAHHVSLMAVQAEAASSLLPDHPADAKRSVEIIGDTARQALTELRRLLGVLRGPAERLETAPAPSLGELSAVLEQVRCAGLPVDFRVEGTPCPLSPGIDVMAYRIVQEALTNTMRHAPAAQAAVTLCYEPGYITVSIADSGPVTGVAATGVAASGAAANGVAANGVAANGVAANGVPQPAWLGPGGFGLAGIAERVASCGGNLTTGPTQAGGFAVTARLPVR
jgi:signal transduction histidine kinase